MSKAITEELDINKTLMFRDRQNRSKIDYLTDYTDPNGYACRAFLVTQKGGAQYVINRHKNGRMILGKADGGDVLNVPEKPKFSWDKPIRSPLHGAICIFKIRDIDDPTHPWTLVFSMPEGRHWSASATDEGVLAGGHKLENYELDKKYEIREYDDISGYTVIEAPYRRADGIAWFEDKDDAELFKKIKEQQA